MNSTIIPVEKLTELKRLVNKIEKEKKKIKDCKNKWIEACMEYNLYQDGKITRSKILIKKYNKRIYEIIKTL
jgi:hypothetical protein